MCAQFHKGNSWKGSFWWHFQSSSAKSVQVAHDYEQIWGCLHRQKSTSWYIYTCRREWICVLSLTEWHDTILALFILFRFFKKAIKVNIPKAPSKLLIAAPTAVSNWITFKPLSKVCKTKNLSSVPDMVACFQVCRCITYSKNNHWESVQPLSSCHSAFNSCWQ